MSAQPQPAAAANSPGPESIVKLDEIEVGENGFILDNAAKMLQYADWRFKAGLVPKGYKNPGSVFLAIEAGMAFGFTPDQALKSIAVINGQTSLWGDGLKGVVERSPECEYVHEWLEGTGDEMVAICETKRKNRPEPLTRKFSVAHAKRAGLWKKETYQLYPERMLQMRARAFCLRDQYADLLKGLGDAQELLDLEVSKQPGLKRPRAKIASDASLSAPAQPAQSPQPSFEAPGAEQSEPVAPESLDEPGDDTSRITAEQLTRYHTIKGKGPHSQAQMKAHLREVYGIGSSKDIPNHLYDEICEYAAGDAPAPGAASQPEPGYNG